MTASTLLGADWLSALGATYLMIALAEIGDKSQLVCMTLAARHRAWPVAIGAIAAFCILNLLAVLFGAAVAAWLPGWLVASAVAILFTLFGIQSFRQASEEPTAIEEKSNHSLIATSFMLIFMAEFGDKTQIAVAGLASTAPASAVWTGAVLALGTTTLIACFAGARLLHRLPVHWIHRVAGTLFLIMAAFAAMHALSG
ncbi:MAG TPA: TMEM165/GDT1 family protein [Rhodocyclaceae bacterium]|nr:TMEM165/GDT1 family protein [Rhodocyclaceae bacterium]